MEKDFKFKDVRLKISGKNKLLESKKSGVFDKVKLLFPFFIEKQPKTTGLVGRVHAELQKNAHAVLLQLKTLKDNLKQELDSVDNQLWLSFEAVINPLIREFSQIEKKMDKADEGIDQSLSAFKRYEEWIRKAKAWVSLSANPDAKRKIIEAVIGHTLRVSDDLIDRDLKTLNDYKLHELYNLGLDFEEIKTSQARLDKDLQPHVEGLLNLKDKKPQDLQLHHLSAWKAKMDEDRAHYYHAALHAIDSIINEISPKTVHQPIHEYLREPHEKILALEEELPIFLGHLHRVDLKDPVKRQLLENQLAYLEDEAHKVNQDLRLTPDLVERVDIIISDLEKAHQFFS